ncbi:protein-L-isoaspartate(D-aspartate) O-methyltransferase [Testudinibacter sp. TR-2022]|uniref:protein-L-isoaspartate(D-aspartate) O-methyltransferase n=1 Tax=Testudinibacter sp. TR-2022 TaxID=2585029 RepID=UPI00111A53C3|nr:protein-L-isoaspartate(D-aspartate) O-methyltransferase [Testudinibacter sp. TR-2022]TNH03459.1 protein-L-isoaspartate(D-aspartate) O-methyltransferase [Pasteurellaceae bacterium Phil31]TNH07824.1 protein-L-isoaspartate(D-aspartate) O-methyltransferase [Testudinibacter sp. TR-2022]TNH09095.1 protein-L-isoaspartate(D-aspartate) O-methyltransferase [Testudinibacter sp. TR-2022]TNH13051.1 protein-L-isoaspartate(D-aspartate) O-methyltransferase [Testudinibacter sp. TR-2022]TNH19340.1 protein-L-
MSKIEQRRLVQRLQAQGIKDDAILQAIYEIPRAFFVEEAFTRRCYENMAIPIGEGQTLSQPYIVARMTELLGLQAEHHVLEIGTGSGYQTALLAKLCHKVYSVERIKKLQWQAIHRLKKLELHNVQLRHADGWEGWKAKAPFDAIMVTAAAENMPIELLQQLRDGGRMVIPIGVGNQILQLITRIGDRYRVENIEDVKFVPLVAGELQ